MNIPVDIIVDAFAGTTSNEQLRQICKSILWNTANREFQRIIDSGDLLETKLNAFCQIRDDWRNQERILYEKTI